MRTALVTGSGSGIGREIAKQLGASGHHVIVADINYEAANETAESMVAGECDFRCGVCNVGLPRKENSVYQNNRLVAPAVSMRSKTAK